MVRAAIFAAAQSTEKRLTADRWNEGAINGAVLPVAGGGDEGMTFLEFGTRLEARLDQRIERSVGFDKAEWEKFGSVRDKFNAGVEMQDFCKTGGSEALFFESLAQSDLIALGLNLHAQFVAFEGEAGDNGIVQLSLILLRDIQSFVDHAGKRPGICQIVVAQSSREGGV